MKLQNLVIIFIIIIIPIIAIFTLYLNLETKTIVLQTDYDTKLIQATKEAVEAFDINTTEWNNEYSTLANTKRRNIMASINVFTSSLADKLGIGGTSKESILTYVPAIVFTMYDGYYIYSPTYVPKSCTNNNGVQLFYYESATTNETKITASATQNIGGTVYSGEPMYHVADGKTPTGIYDGTNFTTTIEDAKKIYKHVLKTFVPYSIQKGDYTINYTLDNYVRIYGEDVAREGYINDTLDEISIEANKISTIKYRDESLQYIRFITEENIPIKENDLAPIEIETYQYIYNSNGDKRYYDNHSGSFFVLNDKYKKVFLPETEIGTSLAEYKKVLVCTNTSTGEYLEAYQLLNGEDRKWLEYSKDEKKYNEIENVDLKNELNAIPLNVDCSYINYYVETYCFNKWLNGKFSEDDVSNIIAEKNAKIIENINNNLKLSIANYRANSGIDYMLPELSDKDWEQALSNISMITFFQGIKVGLKNYNNYAVVTSTENGEYVSENSLYYIGGTEDDYYHQYLCSKGMPATHQAYRNIDFKANSYKDNDEVKYYYKHSDPSKVIIHKECFDCIVNRNNYNTQTDSDEIGFYNRTFYNALARERYIQMQRTKLVR